MRKRASLILASLLLVLLLPDRGAISQRTLAQTKAIPAPADVLGFTPGDDRKLASWAKVVEYFQKLAAASDRVKLEEVGKSTMGAPFVYATISAPDNLQRLDEFKLIQRQLSDPRGLGSWNAEYPLRYAGGKDMRDRDRKAVELMARGKTVVAITCGIHSTEVGSYLSSMLIAYRLASSNEPEVQEILKNTIILLVPSTNPDGVDIVNNWYQKTLGTPYEGTDPPELYHKYTGHDDNRDWYAFTQVETQLVVEKILNVWHPQIVHDIHQQGQFGSRLFLPPYMQPVEPNVPKQIVEGYTELGNYLAKEMRATGYKGITTDSTYDAWSPSRAYSHYHGGVRILQETASCRLATPITVRFDQLRAGEGYDPRKETPNFGPIWQGGEWHIRDITNTMTSVAFLLLKHAAQNREHWLQRFYEIEKEAVWPAKPDNVAAYVIPARKSETLEQTKSRRALIEILERAGVEITPVGPSPKTSKYFKEAAWVINLAQPNAPFARALLRPQIYPDLRDSTGRPIPPYDVTAHALPLLMNVEVVPASAPIKYEPIGPGFFGGGGQSCSPQPLVGLYKSFVPAMDEGWTRWVLTKRLEWDHCFRYESLTDGLIRSGSIRKFQTIVIPDQPRLATLNGHRKGAMPDEFTGGLGEQGVKALREFVEAGGTLVCLNRASDFAIEQFKLPVRDVVDGLPRTDFYVPGSILRIELDTNDPITKGMPKESIAWVENSPVFEVLERTAVILPAIPPNEPDEQFALRAHAGRDARAPDTSQIQARVLAWYPKEKDPLLSGWLLGADRLKGKAALVEVTMGKGRIILFGFRAQYRGQSLATYPLFFNAIIQRN
jgi:hypothetical protein